VKAEPLLDCITELECHDPSVIAANVLAMRAPLSAIGQRVCMDLDQQLPPASVRGGATTALEPF
jgi:hypothetical protein